MIIPLEMFGMILTFLNERDLINCSRTCKVLHAFITSRIKDWPCHVFFDRVNKRMQRGFLFDILLKCAEGYDVSKEVCEICMNNDTDLKERIVVVKNEIIRISPGHYLFTDVASVERFVAESFSLYEKYLDIHMKEMYRDYIGDLLFI